MVSLPKLEIGSRLEFQRAKLYFGKLYHGFAAQSRDRSQNCSFATRFDFQKLNHRLGS